MQTFTIELSMTDKFTVMDIGKMCQAVVDLDKKAPEKFTLGSGCAAHIIAGLPITLEMFDGMADAVGGYYVAVSALTEKETVHAHDLSEADKFMQLINKIRPQVKHLKVVK